MIIAVALAAVLTLPILSKLVLQDFASPPALYAFVWGVTVLLFHLPLVDFDPVGALAWGAVALSGLTFIAGSLAGMSWGLPDRIAHLRPLTASIDPDRLARVLAVCWLLGLVGLAIQLWHLEQSFGLATYLTDPPKARKLHSYVPIWGYLNLLNVANVAWAAYFHGVFRRIRPWMVLIPLTALASAFMTTDRTRLFYMVLWSFFIWVYARGGLRFSRAKLVRLTMVGAILLVFFVAVAIHFKRRYTPFYPQYLHFPPSLSFMVEPYVYLTGTFPGLQAFMEDTQTRTWGRFSFAAPVAILNLAFPELEPVDLQGKLYFVPMEINTFSYLHQFYQDFGWGGVLVGPFICGLLAGFVYGDMRRRPTPLRLYFSGLIAFCTFISVFVNFFTQEATWFFVLSGWLTVRLAAPRAGVAQAASEREPVSSL